MAFGACAVAAFAGGTYHGFLPWLPQGISGPLWKATLLAIGFGSFAATVATAQSQLGSRWVRPLRAMAGIKVGAYSVVVLSTDAFLVAIVDYSVAFGFVAAAYGFAWIRRGEAPAAWAVAGVATSFAAAGIQALGIAPHAQFNHNDLYHVVQMAGMWLLYRGASRSRGVGP